MVIESSTPVSTSKCKIFIACILGFVTMSIMQTNLGIALVDRPKDDKNSNLGNLNLDFHEKNLLLSAFLYGNLLAPLGGLLVRHFDPFWLYSFGIMMMAVLTMLSPIIIHHSLYLFAACRVAMGMFQALARTSLIQTASSWKTLKDAVFFVALIAVGNNLGIAVSYSFTVFLINNVGWDESFYIIGATSLLVVISGALFVSKDRQENSCLQKTIRACIEAQYKKNRKKNPYSTILSSKSVYALNYIKFILAGGMGCSMYYGPQFIENINKHTPSSLPIIGILSSLINVGPLIAYPLSATLLTCLIDVQHLNPAKAHGINFYFGSTLAIVFLLSCAFLSEPVYRICSLAFFQTFVCFSDLTTQIVPLYLTPNYAGFVSSLGTLCRTFGSISLPLLWKYIKSREVVDEWKLSFISIAVLTSFTIPIFAVLISFKPLPSTSDELPTNFGTVCQERNATPEVVTVIDKTERDDARS